MHSRLWPHIIDFGAKSHGSIDIDNEIANISNLKFSIFDSDKLFTKMESAKTILYIGDNAGEIVMDKLFLETIKHPNVYYAVKGSPVMNSALSSTGVVPFMERYSNSTREVAQDGRRGPKVGKALCPFWPLDTIAGVTAETPLEEKAAIVNQGWQERWHHPGTGNRVD